MNRERDFNANGSSIHWEYFVNPSKAASPQFNELCRGLASIIRTLEPSRDVDLSPARLANFYRSCGGNYDELFMNTGEHGVAFLYRTLGCYHSLQPTRNAFEAPSVPCLTDDGYVRWQTLQLLLCPEEHANMIQKALEVYEVPRKNGGFFPRVVPRECFPARPDADMEKWHRFVTSQISQDNYQRRLKYSPYQSPQPEGNNSPGGYFARAPPVRRPSPNFRRRESLSEEELARQAAAREARKRRSSVPDIASPGGTLYSEKESAKKSRSRSANRPKSGDYGHHQRQRSYTSAQAQYYPPPSPRAPPNLPSRRPESHEPSDISRRRYQPNDRPSTSRSSTASDAESDDSYIDRRKSRSSGEDSSKRKSRWGSSLMPNFFLSSSKRRHSSDGRVPTLKDDSSSPRRNNSIRKYKTEGPEFSPSGRPPVMPERPLNGVRFGNSFNPNEVPVRPDGTAYQQVPPPPPPPTSYRYSDPQANAYPVPHTPNMRPVYPPPSEALPPNTFNNHFEARKQGMPIRVATVNGVNGRRYAPPETKVQDEPVAFNRRNRTSSMRNFATSTVI